MSEKPRLQSTRDALEELIALEPAEPDTWISTPPTYGQPRLFGGHALALALAAAARTTRDDQPVHSLNAQFLRTVPVGEPLRLSVHRVRDGRNVSLRRVELRHANKTAVIVDFSFHHWDELPHWQAEPRDPQQVVGVPRAEGAMKSFVLLDPFDIVPVHPYEKSRTRPHPYWARPRDDLGDDTLLHACALVWLSDLAISVTAHRPGTPKRERHGSMTLQHNVWFHRPPRFDGWLRVDVEPRVNGGGRGLAFGHFTGADGTIGPRFVQDVLLNPPGERPAILYRADGEGDETK